MESKQILISAIGSHQSLDHKLHLIQDVENLFKDTEKLEKVKTLISGMWDDESVCAGEIKEIIE